MLGLELVVLLGAAVPAGNVLGQRFRIAPPVVLLITGWLLGFIPMLRETQPLLVTLTAWVVAAVAHALGLAWGPAWVLGAAVAPTDATAVSPWPPPCHAAPSPVNREAAPGPEVRRRHTRKPAAWRQMTPCSQRNTP